MLQGIHVFPCFNVVTVRRYYLTSMQLNSLITSAKEVMFSPGFVCGYVIL